MIKKLFLFFFVFLAGAGCDNISPSSIQVTEIKGIEPGSTFQPGTQITIFVEASGTSDLSFTWEDAEGIILKDSTSSSLIYTIPASSPNNFIKVSVKDKSGNQKIRSVNFTVILPTPTTGPSIVSFAENFDDGIADNFFNKVGLWSVLEDETKNRVLDVSTMGMPDEWANINFGNSDWSNYTFSIRIRIIDYKSDAPLFNIQFRDIYRVAFTPYWDGIDLAINQPWTIIAGRQTKIERDKWYLVTIATKNENIKIYLDNKLMIDETDTTKYTGLLGVSMWPNTHSQIDDILVSPNE